MLRYALLIAIVSLPALAFAVPKNPDFYKADGAFEVTGTVSEIDDDDITIRREGMPRVEMEVSREHTKITLNGNEARLRDLRPGTEVRAAFQIDGDDIVAVRIEATTSGSGGK